MTESADRRMREAAPLFEELAELPAEEAQARLSELQKTDAPLAALLRGLLAAERGAGDFLEGGAVDYVSPTLARELAGEDGAATALPGEWIGPYVLISLLGRGGMGEVWVAERKDGQFEQQVALKLLTRGTDSEGVRRRFLQERQVLASLEHPHIARLLDGGTTSDGRPYFVMELVRGDPITEHCRKRNPPLEDRLRLVATCAEAVAAAHRRLVVHRDIKPSNVLVDEQGQVKLLDFGIAKVLSEEPDALQTRADERVLTPSYAAPEQILGEPITTATDVYALGAVFYELLTGAPPHERSTASAAQLASQVERETIERPSRAVFSAAPGDSPRETRRLSKLLEGDVDAIVQKALRREPERRYAGAGEMAEDIRRHLSGQRVVARPDTFGYRARKFGRRHRAGVAAAALVFLSLVGGLTAAVWQARIARVNARRAARVQDFLIGIFQGSDPTHSRGETVTARQLLVDGTRRIEKDLRAEPEVQATLYDTVSQIQRSLGALPEARTLAERALAARRRLFGDDDPLTLSSRVTLAEALAALGDERAAMRELHAVVPKLVTARGADNAETIRAKEALADALANDGQNDEALTLAKEIVASRGRRSGAATPELAADVNLLGMIQESASRFDDAEKSYRQAIAIFDRSLGANDPRTAKAHGNLAELLAYRGRRDEAEKEFAVTIAAKRKSLGADHPELAATLIDLGLLYVNQRKYGEADASFAEALRIYRPLHHADTSSALRLLGMSLMAQERFPEAQQHLEEALSMARASFGPKHASTLTALGNLGEVQLRRGGLEAAEKTLRDTIAGLEEMFGKGADNLRSPLNVLGELRRLQGRLDEAKVLHRRALAIQLKTVGPNSPAVAATRFQLALDLLAQPTAENLDEARAELDSAIALTRKVDAEHPRLDEMLLASGRVARYQGDRERADRELEEALERLRRHHGEKDSRTAAARAALGGRA